MWWDDFDICGRQQTHEDRRQIVESSKNKDDNVNSKQG